MERILVAGATGHVGRHLVPLLKEAGYVVRALSRGTASGPADEYVRGDLTKPGTLDGCCTGIDRVISCAGASLSLGDRRDRRAFMQVDFEGNRNLLEQAQLQRVRQFVYVSLYGGQRLMHTEYARAHEYLVLALENAGVPYTVVRPTGLFYIFLENLRMAQRGRGVVIGKGNARTNPIHEADVARLCVEALGSRDTEIAAGGPETLTRREIVELAFEVAGRAPKITSVPAWVFTGMGKALKPVNLRLAGLLAFGAAVGTRDAIAPVRGAQTLRAYFEDHPRAAARTTV